ncbi:MAG: MqnA/MqnD/SBP family protein [Thermosulfidibacteraceae bacterium]|jgi:1,4-dihydroxy-6-naphthoate synthase
MKIKIAFSPCPNDLFIFYRFLTEDREKWDIKIGEMEELNQMALNENVDVVKVSAGIYPLIKGRYEILGVGNAFGIEDGPILVAKNKMDPKDIKKLGIPGKTTTAYLLFKKFFGEPEEVVVMNYDEIIPSILEDKVDAGILIHEGRLIYKNFNLTLVADLLELWQNKHGQRCPLPLGLIVIRHEIRELKGCIEEEIKNSLLHSENNYDRVIEFILNQHPILTKKMVEEYIRKFVNRYTYHLPKEGLKSLFLLFEELSE